MTTKFLFFITLLLTSVFSLSATILEQANESYRKGEQSSTLLEREQAFNQALNLYQTAASSAPAPSSQLYRAIANTYFQLNEHPWSILYNYRALKLDPRNAAIVNAIQDSRNRLGLDAPLEPFSTWQRLLLQSFISTARLMNGLFVLFLITFLSLSLFIWSRHSLLKKLSIILSSITLLLLFILMLNYYFSPIEGILVTSTGYYREPDMHQAQLTSLPLKAGTKMRILAIDKQGSWIKTADTNGLIGYIPSSAIRII